MSYARFGSGGSDVYVYLHVSGYLNCCCSFDGDRDFNAVTTDEMVAHLKEHQAKGDTVLERTFEGLLADKVENDKWMKDIQNGMCYDCDGDGKCRYCKDSDLKPLDPCLCDGTKVCGTCEGDGKLETWAKSGFKPQTP